VGEWFNAFSDEQRESFHVIASNPPYIADSDNEVEDSVAQWEPHSALFAGADGLADIRVIAAEASRWLVPGGMLVVEMGYTQADAVMQLFIDAQLTDVRVHNDTAGKPRFVSGIRAI